MLKSIKVFYLSTTGDNLIYFGESFNLGTQYMCSIEDIYGQIKTKGKQSLFLCTDICEESFIHEVKLPVLRQIKYNNKTGNINNEIRNYMWLNVNKTYFNSIRLYICDAL